jgi:hypothetical protein
VLQQIADQLADLGVYIEHELAPSTSAVEEDAAESRPIRSNPIDDFDQFVSRLEILLIAVNKRGRINGCPFYEKYPACVYCWVYQ